MNDLLINMLPNDVRCNVKHLEREVEKYVKQRNLFLDSIDHAFTLGTLTEEQRDIALSLADDISLKATE